MDDQEIISEVQSLDLIKLARNAIELRLSKIASFSQLMETEKNVPIKRGAFVSIFKDNEPLGCMGMPWPIKSLSEIVQESALKAAFEAPGFTPLEPSDLKKIKIQLTVLTLPKLIVPSEIKIGSHGLIVHNEYGSGLLLPHVPAQYGWKNVKVFLAATSIKAGLSSDAWKNSEIYAFEVEVFKEKSF